MRFLYLKTVGLAAAFVWVGFVIVVRSLLPTSAISLSVIIIVAFVGGIVAALFSLVFLGNYIYLFVLRDGGWTVTRTKVKTPNGNRVWEASKGGLVRRDTLFNLYEQILGV